MSVSKVKEAFQKAGVSDHSCPTVQAVLGIDHYIPVVDVEAVRVQIRDEIAELDRLCRQRRGSVYAQSIQPSDATIQKNRTGKGVEGARQARLRREEREARKNR